MYDSAEPVSMTGSENAPESHEATESLAPSIPESSADPRADATLDEVDQESNVLGRLRRAGIWRHTDSLPSAFDAAADDPQTDVEPDRGETPLNRSAVSAPVEYEPVDDDRGSDRDIVVASAAVRAATTAEKNDAEADYSECHETDFRTDTVPGEVTGTATAGEDDAIEAYMQRLLSRMSRSGSESETIQPCPPSTPHRAPISELELSGEREEYGQSAKAQPLSADEYVPRSQAPELDSRLAAMREIANRNRRTNLITHAHQTTASRSKSRLLGAVAGCTVAAASVFYMDMYPRLATATFAVSSGIALFCMFQALVIRRKIFDGLKLDTESLDADPPQPNEAPQPATGAEATAEPTA
jgi:hypothetical protein